MLALARSLHRVDRSSPPLATRGLNLCMVSDDFLPAATGVGIHLQMVCKELARRGHRVSIITTRRAGEPEQELWHGVTVFRTATVKLFGFYQAVPSKAELRRILEVVKPEVLHSHYLGLLLMRAHAVAEESPAVKHVYTYHMTVDHLTQPWLMRPLRPLLQRRIIKQCNRFDLILGLSPSLTPALREAGVMTPIRTVSNPVEIGEAPAQPLTEDHPFTVLYVGRLNAEKNVGYLIKGFAELTRRHGPARLSIAGHGHQRAALERLCRNEGIADEVTFHGFVDRAQLARLYASADVFVLPSLVETQGLVTMEAMHLGKPVIVTNKVPCSYDLVEDGRSGFIIDPDSLDALVEKLVVLKANRALRNQLGQRGHELAQRFNLGGVINGLEDTYRGLWPSPR